MARFPGAPVGTGQKIRAEGFLLTCRRHSDIGAPSSAYRRSRRPPANVGELPSALLRFEAVRFASLLKFSRKDPAGFIVHISGGCTPNLCWTGLDVHFIMLAEP